MTSSSALILDTVVHHITSNVSRASSPLLIQYIEAASILYHPVPSSRLTD